MGCQWKDWDNLELLIPVNFLDFVLWATVPPSGRVWSLVGFAAVGRKDPIPSTQLLRPDLPGSVHRALSKQSLLVGAKCCVWDPPVGSVCWVSDAVAEAQMCIYILGDLWVGQVWGQEGKRVMGRGGLGTRPSTHC